MTRYYVEISPSLVSAYVNGDCTYPEGWRLIERFGPRSKSLERWIVEDDGAGEEFEDFLVMPIFTMELINGGPETRTFVNSREIMSQL